MHIWDIIFTIIVILVLFLVWIILLDTNRFVVRTLTVRDKRIQKPIRAVVISDLHNKSYGKGNERLLEAIREQKPDVILLAGDLLNAIPKAKLDVPINFLKELAKNFPIYYGNGNHEHRLKLYPETYGDMSEAYAKALQELKIEPLVNVKQMIPDTNILVYGAEIDRMYYKRFKQCPMEEDYMESILGKVDAEQYIILLAHNPNYFPEYAQWGADLVLSGHVHGGVARVPFWGKGVISPNFHVFPKYDGGLFEEGKSKMILSRGLGVHTIPFRVFNPGEIWVVDFEQEV